ncbi:N-acetylgalactosamine kinase-like isoform X2 [Ornithodoros turicata]
MALQQNIVVACAPNGSNTLNLVNVEDGRYPSHSEKMDLLKIDDIAPQWYHYFLCGVKGVVEDEEAGDRPSRVTGMDVVAHGTVPPSAGLSSSSAVVCVAALATLWLQGTRMSKMRLATLCAKNERYIGTQGGGMDQAIAFLAEQGSAKLIQFNPLKTTNVPLPSGATFVVANSCVEMNKAATSHFNTRVVECHLAAKLIAKSQGLNYEKKLQLADVQAMLKTPLEEMVALVQNVLHPEPYKRSELCQLLQMNDAEFEALVLGKNTKHLQEFKLYQRALHVYSEANRVWQFKDVCDRTETLSENEILTSLGKLMNESHNSCRDLYECSHPDLDLLVQTSLRAGALGSRLTGAGWGGCTVTLVPSEKVPAFLDQVKQEFYRDRGIHDALDSLIFVTQPGEGAAVILP